MTTLANRASGLIRRASQYAATLAVALTLSASAEAQDLNSFDGRTVEFIVGSNPGGGYDRTTRLVAEYLEKHLPGSTIAVSNQARFGGMVALNRLAASSNDAPVIMMFNTGFLLSQLAEDEQLRVDFSQLDYIGKVTNEARYFIASAQSGIQSWDDMVAYTDDMLVPTQSPKSAGYVQSVLLANAFGITLKPITGFSGSEARAAITKGELQMEFTSESNVSRLIKAGGAVPILRFGPHLDEEFAHIPSASTVVETPEQEAVVKTISAMTELGRIIVAAPGMSEADLATLRAAFLAAVADPGFIAGAADEKLALAPADGDATKALILQVLGSDGPIKGLVEQALK